MKIKPLYVAWDPASEKVDRLKAKLEAGLEQYAKDYEAHYEACNGGVDHVVVTAGGSM